MNKYQLMFSGSITLTIAGILLSIYGLVERKLFFYIGLILVVAGLTILGTWITKAYTYICKNCYTRINVNKGEALFALPAGSACRKIYCPKCRRKMPCKARRVSLRRYVF
ncbi:MAG: hypothetical protein K2O03_14325 [Lachnospiraceae bacterium]|nr:hypothetical protein [Lachnospiraceae bacterium]